MTEFTKPADDFTLVIASFTQTRFHQGGAIALLDKLKLAGHVTDEEIAGCYVDIPMGTVRTNRVDKTKKKVFQMPNLSNFTAAGLIDELGGTREEISYLKRLEGIYKIALQARLVESGEISATSSPGGDGVDDDGEE